LWILFWVTVKTLGGEISYSPKMSMLSCMTFYTPRISVTSDFAVGLQMLTGSKKEPENTVIDLFYII